MNRKWKAACILAILTALALDYYFMFGERIIKKNTTLSCHFMAYACGDCYPQYKVEKAPGELEKKLLGKDIMISFNSWIQEEKFLKQVERCAICYNYNLTGNLYYSNRYKCYLLKVINYKMTETFRGCCTH